MPQSEEVPDEPKVQPNIEAIAKLIAPNGPVHRAEEASQAGRADLGNYYKRIQDDHHGHRGAVKMIRKLIGQTGEARSDFMRTFEPLAEHFNLFPSQHEGDLVDSAERQSGGAPASSSLDKARQHLESATRPEPMFDDGGGDTAAAPPAPEAAAPEGKKPAPKKDPVPGKKGDTRAKLSVVTGGGDPAAPGTAH